MIPLLAATPPAPRDFIKAQQGSEDQKYRFIEKFWLAANKDIFKGKLKPPNAIRIGIDDAGNGGEWYADERIINIAESEWSTWKSFRTVLLHEMCHQATDEISKVTEKGDHGPVWASWCEKAGLPYPHILQCLHLSYKKAYALDYAQRHSV